MYKTRSGFTLVELLIVIVVIAILAAITIVSYNGIQNRANDAAVQSDLEAYAKKAQLFNIQYGQYPANLTDLDSLDMKASQGSYKLDHGFNLYYCVNRSDYSKFAFAGQSKSGTLFYASSEGKGDSGNNYASTITTCSVIGGTGDWGATFYNTSGYNHNRTAGNLWNDWTK